MPTVRPFRESCPECGNYGASRCINCSAWFCCVLISDRDDEYCADCRPNTDDRVIRDASNRAYPTKRPAFPPYPHFLYMGVELEVECGDSDKWNVADRIHNAHSDKLMLKEDGSLNNGFEMVTGPFSLDVHKSVWPNILQVASEAGARSWRRKSTGLHVHLSRDFFSPLSVGKLLVFLNSPNTRPQIVRLAGRESPDFAAMEQKKLKDAYCWDMKRDITVRTGYALHLRHNMARGGSRYEILNLQNANTLEVRIFKGTLHLGHVLADLEFCHAVSHWVIDVSMNDCESWNAFWAYVLKHKKLYSNLIAYMSPAAKTVEM